MINYKKIIEENIDTEYKKFQNKLLPGVEDFKGVRMPIIRKLAKEISKEDSYEFLQKLELNSYEEKMLYGLVVANLEIPFGEHIEYILNFLKLMDNWGLCDSFCSSLKPNETNKMEIFRFVQNCAVAEGEYYQRFAAVMILIYFLEDEYIESSLRTLANINNTGYYTKMGVAWAISAAFVKQKEKTQLFMKNEKLDQWILKKAIQKIRESKLVSKDELEVLLMEVNYE